MSKLIGRRVVVRDAGYGYLNNLVGMVGTVAEIDDNRPRFKIRVTFYGHDTRPFFSPKELRYLNNREVVL